MGPGISSLNPGGQVVTKEFVMQPVAPIRYRGAGTAVTAKIHARDPETGSDLVEGTDCELIWTDNASVGYAKLIVFGIGEYGDAALAE